MKRRYLAVLGALVFAASSVYGISLLSPTGDQVAGGVLTGTTLSNLVADFASIGTVLGVATGAPSGTGAICLTTNCTLVTPALGTPTALVLTSATGLPAAAVGNGITGAQILNNTITSADLATNTIQFVSVPLTLAQIQGMFTTPVVVVAAQGSGTLIEIQSCTLDLIRGSAAFTSGGIAQLSYGAGVTVAASATVAAATFTTFPSSQAILFAGAMAVTATSATLNTAVNFTNATQTFATGTGATGILDCAYRVHTGLS